MGTVYRIVLVSEPLLRERYGEKAAALLDVARECAGDPSLLVVSQARDALGLRDNLRHTLARDQDAKLPVLLLGGTITLPSFSVVNPVALVQDNPEGISEPNGLDTLVDEPLIDTDNPYGVLEDSVTLRSLLSSSRLNDPRLPESGWQPPELTADACAALQHLLFPRWAVGRIPDCEGMTGDDYARLIRKLCGARPCWDDPARSFTLSTQSWRATTLKVAELLGFPKFGESPTLELRNFERSPGVLPGDTRQMLFNVHGSDKHQSWYGDDGNPDRNKRQRPEVFSPAAARRVSALHGVVAAQGCFSAHLRMLPEQKGGEERERTLQESIGLCFLHGSAVAFLGATSVTYGMDNGALGTSDVLVHEFLQAAMQGLPLGQALCHARHALGREISLLIPHTAYKALLQFVLFGDPAIHSEARRWDRAFEPASAPALESFPLLDVWERVAVRPSQTRPGPDGWRLIAQRHAPCSGGTAVLKAFRRLDRLSGEDIVQFRLRLETPDGAVREEQTGGGVSVHRLETWWPSPVTGNWLLTAWHWLREGEAVMRRLLDRYLPPEPSRGAFASLRQGLRGKGWRGELLFKGHGSRGLARGPQPHGLFKWKKERRSSGDRAETGPHSQRPSRPVQAQ